MKNAIIDLRRHLLTSFGSLDPIDSDPVLAELSRRAAAVDIWR